MSDIEKLIDSELVRERVKRAWNVVFTASSKVLVDEKRFCFEGMGIIPDPNIHQIVVLLRTLEAALSTVAMEFDDLPYDETRLILNAKEQINRMERVAIALKANDKEAFTEQISLLEKQAAF